MTVGRQTQIVLEVLATSSLEMNVGSILSISQNLLRAEILISAATLVSIDHNVSSVGVKQSDEEATIIIDQTLDHNLLFETIIQTLTFTDSVDVGIALLNTVSSSITFAQSASHNLLFPVANNVITFEQEPTSLNNQTIIIAHTTVTNITQSATPGFVLAVGTITDITQSAVATGSLNRSTFNTLSLGQLLVLNPGTKTRSLTTIVSLAQLLQKSIIKTAATIVNFVGVAVGTRPVENILNISQTVVVKNSKKVGHILNIVQTVLTLNTKNVAASNTVTFVQGISIDSLLSECTFSPSIGSEDSVTEPVFGTATLTLTYPFISPTTTLVLRNPNFGSSERLQYQRINRRTRGGQLEIFSDSSWPKQKVLPMTIELLKEAEKVNLMTFLSDSLGKEIGLLDHENTQWRGIIITPEAEVTQISRDNYSVNFEFEGEPQ